MAISSDEIILILPQEFNAETYRVSFEFQVVIRYVYACAPLPFSNSRQETSSRSPASCHLPHSLIKQIYRFSLFLFSNFTVQLSIIYYRRSISFFLLFAFLHSLSP